MHTKKHVLIQFTPEIVQICVSRAFLKSMILKKKKFFKKHDFEEKNFF